MLSLHLVSLLALLGTLAEAGPIHIPRQYTKRSACKATNGTATSDKSFQAHIASGGAAPTGGYGGWGGHHGWSHTASGASQSGAASSLIEIQTEAVKQTGETAAVPTVTETPSSAVVVTAAVVTSADPTPAVAAVPSAVTSSGSTTTSSGTDSSTDSDSDSSTDSSGSSSDEETLLTLHNNFRAQYGASALTWDSTLATYATSYASKCVFKHSGGPYGENLAAGGGGNYDITAAFNSWANEAADYNWGSPGFSESTGHFTQVVWKATTKVGCGYVTCGADTVISGWNSDANYLVCEYSPAGNVVNAGEFAANVGTKDS